MIREAIKTAMKSQKVTQRRLAEDCGVYFTSLCHFLKGRRPLPLDQVERVLKYLKIDLKKG